MPSQDAGRFAVLDAVEHLVEDRSTGHLGRLLLDEDA